MKKTVLAVSIAAMLGGLAFPGQTEYGFAIHYYYPRDYSFGELALKYL